MLSPSEEAKLRDEMCVVLLEATSHPDALARARREAHGGVPAYDPVPAAHEVPARRVNQTQPCDLFAECVLCGRGFVVTGRGHGRCCSQRCNNVVTQARYRRGLVA